MKIDQDKSIRKNILYKKSMYLFKIGVQLIFL